MGQAKKRGTRAERQANPNGAGYKTKNRLKPKVYKFENPHLPTSEMQRSIQREIQANELKAERQKMLDSIQQKKTNGTL